MKQAPQIGMKVKFVKPADEFTGAIGTVYCHGMLGGDISNESCDSQGICLSHTIVLENRSSMGQPIFMLVEREDIEPVT